MGFWQHNHAIGIVSVVDQIFPFFLPFIIVAVTCRGRSAGYVDVIYLCSNPLYVSGPRRFMVFYSHFLRIRPSTVLEKFAIWVDTLMMA